MTGADTDLNRRRALDSPRAVEVLRDGVWWPGRQSAWLRWTDGAWRAAVTYSVAPGAKYSHAVPADRVRLRAEPDTAR